MKISELICELLAVLSEQGDVNVKSYRPDRDYGGSYGDTEVEFDGSFEGGTVIL